jgi:hypothetical protein
MIEPGNRIDPELLQARWVLGGVGADEWVNQAALALEQGFDGTALRQLAGLVRPTLRDLGHLPERALAEMGLNPCDKELAVSFLVARGTTLTNQTILALVESFPNFSNRWRSHLAHWRGEPAGSYIDMAEFVHFVVEDLYEQGNLDETRRVFECLERLFVEGNQETRDLIGLGFFETLQNFASWRSYGNTVFEQFFGPMSKQVWNEIKRQWRGKSSLMDVIRAEKNSSEK